MSRVSWIAMFLLLTLFVSRAWSQQANPKKPLNGFEQWDTSRLEDGWEVQKATFDKKSQALKFYLEPKPGIPARVERTLIPVGCKAKCYDADGEEITSAEVTWANGEEGIEILKVKLGDIEDSLRKKGAQKESVKKVKLTDK